MPTKGLYLRKQVTPFVILFIERDGSTYMISMLSAHPDINVVYERFAVMKEDGKTALDQLAWANEHFHTSLLNPYKAVGFKTKLKDVLDLDSFTKLLHEKQIHIIHMQRQNVIKAVVSRINARRLHDKTGNWNLYNEADRLPPVNLDLDDFDAMLQNRVAQDTELAAYVSQLKLPKLTVCYENLLQDRDAVLRQIFEFLHVKWVPVEAKTKKNTGDDLREVIENYDELRSRYVGTRYETMFDEVLAS